MDARFRRLRRDPRFRKTRKKDVRAAPDDRFSAALDEQPHRRPVDKYGRTVPKNKHIRGSNHASGHNSSGNGLDLARGEVLLESSDEEAESIVDDSDQDTTLQLQNTLIANHPSSFSDELLLPPSASEEEGAASSRIAVVNLDWDHIKASDLHRIFHSQLPSSIPDGRATPSIISVVIYTSEYGRKMISQEQAKGPSIEVSKASGLSIQDTVASTAPSDPIPEENEALRRYQLMRMQYYYAIVTCDSPSTASYLVSELNGTELERTANVLELSYVPADMDFDQEIKDKCTSDTLPATNKPLNFATNALRHSKVELTWDGDDPDRIALTRRKLTQRDMEMMDFTTYLASSDSEGDIHEGRSGIRELLLGEDPSRHGLDKKERQLDIEVTFLPAVRADQRVDSTSSTKELSTIEAYRSKLLKKRKRDSTTPKPDLGISKETTKHKYQDELASSDEDNRDDFVQEEDARFSAVQSDPLFARDPTSSRFKSLTQSAKRSQRERHQKMRQRPRS